MNQLQRPIDKLAPVVKEAQAKLREIDRAAVADRSGATIDREGNLRVEFLRRKYVIDHVEWTVKRADDGAAPPSLMQSLILTYLYTADGTPPIDRWMGFRELPNGLFYAQAFQGYTGTALVRDLNGDVAAFKQASEKLQGAALAIGDVGCAFQVLPRLKLAVIMWAGRRRVPGTSASVVSRNRAALSDYRRSGYHRQFIDRANRESSQSMNASVAIQTRALTKSYGKVPALRGVDLDVRRGEIFGFLGPNGSGKTTTIRCLLDLIRPDGGTLRVLGRDPQRESVAVRAQIGYLPGELRLDEGFTVEAALRFFSRLRGNQVDWTYVRQLTDRLHLDLQLRIKHLSKGNKQKVGIVQALMPRPALLLLDEPTGGLDPLMQQQVLRAIREAQANGATVFFSSHVLSEVEEIADRVGIIRRGVVVEVADPQALIDRALRRVRVRFKQPIDPCVLTRLSGVTLIERSDSSSVLLNVAGDMDQLIKTLAAYPVIEVDTERPSLEEVFLAYYAEQT